jgi:hypothetical protein
MTDLFTLFTRYGWQLALVALLGTIIVNLLKTPFKKLTAKILKTTPEALSESNFDVAASILSFLVAAVLGVTYSIIASTCGFLTVEIDGVIVAKKLDFMGYVSNVMGTWVYQVVFYNIWKKFGLKRILVIIFNAMKSRIDANKDSKLTIEDLLVLIAKLKKDGKITSEEIIEIIKQEAPKVADDIISTISADDSAKINIPETIQSTATAVETVAEKIPSKAIQNVATALIDKAEETAQKAVAAPVKPTIKF